MQHTNLTMVRQFARSQPKVALWSRAVAEAARLWRQMRRRSLMRATAHTLYGLSDRTLHDIGIDRSEIDAIVAAFDCDSNRASYDGGVRRWVQ